MLDHLVYATPDLAATVADLNDRLGVHLSEGGAHPGLGTRNYLADLGNTRYLEVVGPDERQPDPAGERLFGVDRLDAPTLLTWAARCVDLDTAWHDARVAGYRMAAIRDMQRESADGFPITWRMTTPCEDPHFGGLTPFLIQWGAASAHPSERAVRGVRLLGLTVRTPDPDGYAQRLSAVGQEASVEHGAPGLRAVLDTPNGHVELR